MSLSCMEDIVRQNVENKWLRISKEINSEYEAMLKEQAAKGSLKSGSTVKNARRIAIAASEKLRDYLVEQYTYAFKEAILVQESLITELDNIAEHIFEKLEIESKAYIQKSLALSDNVSLLESVWQEAGQNITQSREEVALALNGLAIVEANKLGKTLTSLIPSLIKKICAK